jgi:hypothetical protein
MALSSGFPTTSLACFLAGMPLIQPFRLCFLFYFCSFSFQFFVSKFFNCTLIPLTTSYAASESFNSAPTEEAPFYDGTYTVFAEVCEGTCGGTHSGEYQIALGAALFNMVN